MIRQRRLRWNLSLLQDDPACAAVCEFIRSQPVVALWMARLFSILFWMTKSINLLWNMPKISVLGSLRQGDLKFNVSLSHIVKPCLKKGLFKVNIWNLYRDEGEKSYYRRMWQGRLVKCKFFFFCSAGVWTQDLHLEPLHQSFFVIELFAQAGFEPWSFWSLPPE
jgi:hypothetical protein